MTHSNHGPSFGDHDFNYKLPTFPESQRHSLSKDHPVVPNIGSSEMSHRIPTKTISPAGTEYPKQASQQKMQKIDEIPELTAVNGIAQYQVTS